ncbi:hypothetical protein Tco_1216021 [Tanacetum coccineum]
MFQDFRYSDTTHLSRSVEVLKLKNFKKDATLKLFKNGMSMSVQKSQVHKMAKFQDGKEIVLEIGESSLTGLELVQETTGKVVLVNEKPKAVRDRQKSYVDYRRKPLEFEVGDRVLLKVTPWKGVVRFGKKVSADANLHVPLDEIKVDKTLRFVKEPIEIMDREFKKLKCRRITLVKVRWNLKRGPEFTWEHVDQMRIK